MKLKALASFAAAIGMVFGGLTAPANAAGETLDLVEANGTLQGSTIAGYDPTATLRLAIIMAGGTMNWNNNGSNATDIANSQKTIWLEGTQDQLNQALGEITITAPCSGNYKVYGQVSDSGYLRDPITGHLYKKVNNALSFDDAQANAAATPLAAGGTNTFGYIATVTSPLENVLVSNLLGSGWLGASDRGTEGDWKWIVGPEAGTSFYSGNANAGGDVIPGKFASWGGGEPNDWGNDEDYAEIMGDGYWNDINSTQREYTIEWGGMPGDNLSTAAVTTDELTLTVAGSMAGNGTKDDPFLVAGVSDLEAIRSCVSDDYYIKQTADITLPSNWDGDARLYGKYDGNNKTISFAAGTVATHSNYGVWRDSNSNSTSVSNLNVFGNIDTAGYDRVGLLFGYSNAALTKINADGSVTVTSNGGSMWSAGGVIGEGGAKITDVPSTVDIIVGGQIEAVGGIAAYYWGTMRNSSWDGSITTTSQDTVNYVGGLVGETDCANIYSSHSSGTIDLPNSTYDVGGVAGYMCGEMADTYSSVNVNAPNADYVGGLTAFQDGDLMRSYATGNVVGKSNVGGLIGQASWSTIDDVFARGNVTATNEGGALIGLFYGGELNRAYATGAVTAGVSRGLIGAYQNGPSISRLHWDPTQVGVAQPDPLENGESPFVAATDGKSYDYFYNDNWSISNDWDSDPVWMICSAVNDGYPVLAGTYANDPCFLHFTNATAPVVTGTGYVGSPLGITKGSWDAGVTFSYQWKSNGNAISGATDATYTPVEADLGAVITVDLTGSKTLYAPKTLGSSNSKTVIAKPVAPVVKKSTAISIGGFAGNSWWAPKGFASTVSKAVKTHSQATVVTCTGIVAPGGWPAWQKTLGLKRAALACQVAKAANPKLQTKLVWKVAKSTDSIQRGVSLQFNK